MLLKSSLPLFLTSSVVLFAACGGDTNPISPTEPAAREPALLTAEPINAMAELVPNRGCTTFPAFRTRFSVVVTAQRDLIVRGMRFTFTDRAGRRAMPFAAVGQTPITIGSSAMRTSLPVSLPTSMAIPIPGVLTLPGSTADSSRSGIAVSAGHWCRTPVLLDFDCGVVADGILGVSVDIAHGNDRPYTSRFDVRVGN